MLLEQLDAAPDWRCLDTSLSRYEYLWTRTWLYSHSLDGYSHLYCFSLHFDVRTGMVLTSPVFETSGRMWPAEDMTGGGAIAHLPARC